MIPFPGRPISHYSASRPTALSAPVQHAPGGTGPQRREGPAGPVNRSIDASEQRRLVRDCPCPRASWLLVHRATLRHAACGHLLDISYRISALHTTVWTAFSTGRDHPSMCVRYVTPIEAAMERAYSLTAIPCRTCAREHASRRPENSLPSRREGRGGCAHGGGHGRRPSAPHAGTPGNG